MSWIEVEPRFSALFTALRLDSYAAITAHFTRGSALRAEVFVTGATLQANSASLHVFFKQYQYDQPSWRFWNRASKARREFENYARLEALGVPVAQRVAAGEQRDALGRLKRAFIITRAVPGARTLLDFVRSNPARALRRSVFSEVATVTRAMHDANFFYHDLVWRNLLVDESNKLRLIDCPRGEVTKLGRERKRLRDLASLDKSAWKFCRRTERLRFVLQYLSRQRMDEEARRLIRACLDYRRTRWPEDWSGK